MFTANTARIANIGGTLLPKVGLIVRLRTVSMLAVLSFLAMSAMWGWLHPLGFGVKYLMRARAVPTRVRKLPQEQTNHARHLAV